MLLFQIRNKSGKVTDGPIFVFPPSTIAGDTVRANMERQILTLRIVAALVIGSCLLAPTLWQPALDASWAWLLRRPLFNVRVLFLPAL